MPHKLFQTCTLLIFHVSKQKSFENKNRWKAQAVFSPCMSTGVKNFCLPFVFYFCCPSCTSNSELGRSLAQKGTTARQLPGDFKAELTSSTGPKVKRHVSLAENAEKFEKAGSWIRWLCRRDMLQVPVPLATDGYGELNQAPGSSAEEIPNIWDCC